MTAEAWFGLAGVVITALGVWLAIWWRKDRVKAEAIERQKTAETEAAIQRERDAAAERAANEVIVLIERGEQRDEDQPTWNVTVENHSPKPIRDVHVTYSIQAWETQPRVEGQVGRKIKVGPWLGPHTQPFELVKADETVQQAVDWGEQVDVMGRRCSERSSSTTKDISGSEDSRTAGGESKPMSSMHSGRPRLVPDRGCPMPAGGQPPVSGFLFQLMTVVGGQHVVDDRRIATALEKEIGHGNPGLSHWSAFSDSGLH